MRRTLQPLSPLVRATLTMLNTQVDDMITSSLDGYTRSRLADVHARIRRALDEL